MPALTETPGVGPLASIVRATQRLNPCMELDVDVLAVIRAAAASTPADWNAGVLTATSPDTKLGTLRLTPSAPAILFSQTLSATIHHPFKDASNGVEEYALDFFPSPSVAQGVSFTLDSLDVVLNAGQLKGFFRVQVSYYDQNWRAVPMGDPIDILSGDVVASVGTSGGIYKIDFTALGRKFVFASGFQNTVTGSGYDGTNNRTSNVDSKGVSHLLNIPRGLSISIQPMGRNFDTAWIGLVANATAAQFDVTTFWRHASNRDCGPYNPDNQPYSGATTDHNPDLYLVTGAVPGFGAKAVTNGSWGIARRIPTAQRAQNVLATWEQPYHVLRVLSYPSTGTAVNVLDMGAQPTNPVEIRLDDWQQIGTSLSYSLKGSNTAVTGPWTIVDPAAFDGEVITGTSLYRWYQLTTTFTPGPSGATKYASPALQAWSMVERVALSTYRYLKDFDSTVVADPVTAQSQIGEMQLPVVNAGRQDFRDLASQLGSNYAPAGLEAHVYARNTRTGSRYFLNAFRLENRDPQFGTEQMTFVSGMDRLTVKVPAATETFRYPASGQVAITNVTNVGTNYTITVAGTPFTIGALVNYRMHGVTGSCAGIDYAISSNPTTSQFVVPVPNTSIPTPAIGDTIEIHSDVTTRVGAAYVGQDFAAIYADLLAVQAQVPARYRGRLPSTTGRTATYTLPSDGMKALDVLQDVALHCGGFPVWDKGRIQFVDFYGKKDSVFTWGDREIVTLETPLGADRRMPRVRASYGYQADTGKFTNQATYDDNDTILGWGLPNLFDVQELPAQFCRWNDVNEASFVAAMLQKAWKSGVRLWKVKTVLQYPWLSQGDAVTIVTDQYTDRRLFYSADGLTDLGTPIAGRTASLAVIIGKNLWGDEFVVGVRGLDQVSSATVATTGTVAVPKIGTQSPVAVITPSNTESDDTVRGLTFNGVAGSGGGGTNLTWVIKEKIGFAAEFTTASGDATTLPATFGLTRDLRSDAEIRFTVTDTLTGLTSTAKAIVPSQRQEVDGTGHVLRGRPLDDGKFALRATDANGATTVSDAFNGQGSMIPMPTDKGAFSYNAGGPATGRMWVAWTWSGFTIYRSDGTTIAAPSNTALPTPPVPALAQVAGGALGARTRFARIGYIKNHMVYLVGPETSIAILANNLLKVASPASVAGYDGWIPLVGSASNGEFFQTEFPFGSDYIESVGGFNSTTTTPYDNTWMPGGVTSQGLNVTQAYNFYHWYDILLGIVLFASRGAIGVSPADAQSQNKDGHISVQTGPMSATTPAAATTGSGGNLGGGKFG